ncbi:pseudouridine synthase [Tannockella kyphosi]|uniref:pseudouridine synthase n=1 Tax=Tannockella kyphosi TaxID=2899121 RepID=UPI002012798C|nr:pseudouridine synthase [Tannockella kyphosi]
MRLDKLLAHCGIGTRSEVKKYIRKGYVCVNEQIIKKDDYKIDVEKDVVYFDNELIEYRQYVYLMLNKPAGYISATKDNVHPTVLELIEGYDNYDLFPVGRLDIDTEGFLIISNDGDFAHRLLAPSRNHDKVYYAKIEGVVDQYDVETFYKGVEIDTGYVCKSSKLTILSTDEDSSEIEVVIQEGKFHQVKKMFDAIGKPVTYLKRTQIRSIELDQSLELGEFRELDEQEINDLFDEL